MILWGKITEIIFNIWNLTGEHFIYIFHFALHSKAVNHAANSGGLQ